MKLHADAIQALNTVTAYGPGYVEINRQSYRGSLLILPEEPVQAWGVDGFESLTEASFSELLTLRPEIILLGTGAKQRFPHPRLSAALARAGVGLDVMDTSAACRTYNILMAEGRRVLAALLPT